jgi:hypothetical protein
MKTLDYILAGLLILIAVVAFYALISYLGGYGAIIGACIIAGLANLTIEKTTEDIN